MTVAHDIFSGLGGVATDVVEVDGIVDEGGKGRFADDVDVEYGADGQVHYREEAKGPSEEGSDPPVSSVFSFPESEKAPVPSIAPATATKSADEVRRERALAGVLECWEGVKVLGWGDILYPS